MNSSKCEGVVELVEVQAIYLVKLGYLGVCEEVEVGLQQHGVRQAHLVRVEPLGLEDICCSHFFNKNQKL